MPSGPFCILLHIESDGSNVSPNGFGTVRRLLKRFLTVVAFFLQKRKNMVLELEFQKLTAVSARHRACRLSTGKPCLSASSEVEKQEYAGSNAAHKIFSWLQSCKEDKTFNRLVFLALCTFLEQLFTSFWCFSCSSVPCTENYCVQFRIVLLKNEFSKTISVISKNAL